MYLLLKAVIFHCHISFTGGNQFTGGNESMRSCSCCSYTRNLTNWFGCLGHCCCCCWWLLWSVSHENLLTDQASLWPLPNSSSCSAGANVGGTQPEVTGMPSVRVTRLSHNWFLGLFPFPVKGGNQPNLQLKTLNRYLSFMGLHRGKVTYIISIDPFTIIVFFPYSLRD